MYQHITTDSQLRGIIPELYKHDIWGVDSETSGLNPHHDKVVLLQIGRPDQQFVIDTRKVSPESLRPWMEDERQRKILHNGKFDYKAFRGSFGIELEGIRCSFLGEKLLNAGRDFKGFSLEAVMKKYLKMDMDKTLQKSFIDHKGDFTSEQLQYAANDVKHLLPMYREQCKQIQADGLENVFMIENNAVAAFGDMEFDGMRIDPVLWRKTLEENREFAKVALTKMKEVAKEYCDVDLLGEVMINFNSQKQLLWLLKRMGFKVRVRGRHGEEELVEIQSTDKATQKQLRDAPFIKMLGEYRKYTKLCSAYGEQYLNAVDPLTGRFHPDLGQLDTDSGRPASGDSAVNPLNIPKDNRYRHAFIAWDGYVVEVDDYCSCELGIWAEISQDPKLLDLFRKGEDPHCFVASDLYGVKVTKDKKDPNSKLRAPAKALNFG